MKRSIPVLLIACMLAAVVHAKVDLVTLPMRGHVDSLNVSTAGSIALYAAWQARGWQGWKA